MIETVIIIFRINDKSPKSRRLARRRIEKKNPRTRWIVVRTKVFETNPTYEMFQRNMNAKKHTGIEFELRRRGTRLALPAGP